MKMLLKSQLRIFLFVIAGVVDIFSLIQFINQTQFKMSALLGNQWFWLFIVVTLTIFGLVAFFKWSDRDAARKARIVALEKEFSEYRKRVHDEFGSVYNSISELQDSQNKQFWMLEELKSHIKQVSLT